MMRKHVFVSSTYEDLAEHRDVVQKAIRQLGAVDIAMENFGARDERPKEECLRLISTETDVFVGIYAHRYGYIPRGNKKSITEAEYDAASALGITRLIYLVDEQVPWVPTYIDQGPARAMLLKLKNKLRQHHVCGSFSNKDQLATKVAADLGRHFFSRELKHVEADSSGNSTNVSLKDLKSAKEWNRHRNGIYEKNRGVFLVHVINPSKIPEQTYDVFIYLFRHKSTDLSDIDHASFFLGPYWGDKIIKVQNRGGPIGISISAYNPFLCTCCVMFKDGREIHLNRYIDFEMGDEFDS